MQAWRRSRRGSTTRSTRTANADSGAAFSIDRTPGDAGRVHRRVRRAPTPPGSRAWTRARRTRPADDRQCPGPRRTPTAPRRASASDDGRVGVRRRGDEKRRDATRDPTFLRRLLALYATRRARGAGRSSATCTAYRALHGGVWEWTSDFDSGTSEHAGHEAMAGMEHKGGGHEHMLSCASAAIGASNAGDYAAFMRYQFRAGLTRCRPNRCWASAAPSDGAPTRRATEGVAACSRSFGDSSRRRSASSPPA